ncbi:hypothetical protein FOIG_16500 [Fusarium odoratissimum NRRL 54006]|uniref:PD-(D/E)XK nuclease-like domain-containing protein n=2 Tax=Fusarium oxysporum species complex TaxID=171631 RepID=X0J1K1_FUSO5|nr:uncharacterized protein FOIG_16500 [Fusarium odoratissimum NRRL 54006]EXL90231.1 hypothetical protein FOIG_16500 [Fusarium odoratissimum NRRL 54006]TXB96763.1 hypothetical protein FocTR4_00012293 [Fusarium oxysporum f. sp. cubense]
MATDLPLIGWVQSLMTRAAECEINWECEATRNGEIDAKILEQASRKSTGFVSHGPVDFRYSQAAQIIRDSKPREAPSKIVDFCSFGNSELPEKIVLLLAQHSGQTIYENSFIKKTVWNFMVFSASVPRQRGLPPAFIAPIWCACQSPFGMMGKIYIWNTGGGGGPHSVQTSGAAVWTLLMTVAATCLATTAFGK